MRKILSICLLLIAVVAQAQIQEPVKFKSELKTLAAGEAEIVFTATIDKGWHVYSTDLGDGGPISATFNVEKISGATVVGKLQPKGKEIASYDKLFEMNVRYFESTAQFIQKLKLTGGDYKIEGFLEFGACNDENCLPPTQVEFNFSGKAEAAKGAAVTTPAEKVTVPAEDTKPETQPASQTETPADTASTGIIGGADGPTDINVAGNIDLWKPVINDLQSYGETTSQEDMSWFYIFITGFLGGLLALFTPCVWPIIPMTVSFFLKRSKDKKKGIRDAWTYGASIVVIYVTLGLAITLIFGASALNALSTNAVFNILFCLMLVVFAASFFGAFELTLPSKWSNAVDSKAEATSGLLSIFLMAFTLSLVSFSCTGPIIGFLLVQVSTTVSVVAPAIGMTALYYAYEPAVVFYDTTNLRFVQLTSDLQSMRLLTAEEKYFSFQTGRKFVYMTGTLHDNDGMIFAILRDNADKYWMYGMKAGSFSALSQDKDSYFQIEAPDIEKATAFAIHPTSYYLFYVVGNQIHQLDMTSRRHRVLPITFPDGKLKTELSGEKITMIKFNMFILGDASKPVGIKDMQSCLIVGSENETTSGELGGHVRMLSIPTSLDQPAEVYRSYEGFGKVVDVVYRERK